MLGFFFGNLRGESQRTFLNCQPESPLAFDGADLRRPRCPVSTMSQEKFGLLPDLHQVFCRLPTPFPLPSAPALFLDFARYASISARRS